MEGFTRTQLQPFDVLRNFANKTLTSVTLFVDSLPHPTSPRGSTLASNRDRGVSSPEHLSAFRGEDEIEYSEGDDWGGGAIEGGRGKGAKEENKDKAKIKIFQG